MNHAADSIDLTPPETGRWRGPVLLALAAHALLVAALTWGIHWKRDSEPVTVSAELWSQMPSVAAPRANEPDEVAPPPPPPPPTPAPAPKPAPAPAPAPAANTGPTEAQIAIQKKAEEKRRQEEALELQRQADLKKKEEARQLAEREAQAKADKAKKAAEDARKQREAEQQRQQEQKKRDEQLKAEEQKKHDAEAARQKAAKDKADKAAAAQRDAQIEADRKKNLARMMGLAGASGDANAKGTAKQDSGPSASYAGKVVGRVKPNIVFTDAVSGNPRAEVEVHTLPDGTIVGSKIVTRSGNSAWDDAVLRAVERTAKLPRDENGKVPATLILGFRPND